MKTKFCPKCKSINVKLGMIPPFIRLLVHPEWECLDCGFKLNEFPEKEIKKRSKKK